MNHESAARRRGEDERDAQGAAAGEEKKNHPNCSICLVDCHDPLSIQGSKKGGVKYVRLSYLIFMNETFSHFLYLVMLEDDEAKVTKFHS